MLVVDMYMCLSTYITAALPLHNGHASVLSDHCTNVHYVNSTTYSKTPLYEDHVYSDTT